MTTVSSLSSFQIPLASALLNNVAKSNVPTDEQKELTLSFQDINYSSSDGCNGQGGEFEIEDNKISFTKGMSTMRYCGDEMKHLIYSVPFGSVKSMEIKKDQLQLLDSDKKVIATYTRKK